MGLLDFIFPKYCVNCKKLDSYICPNCFSFLSFDIPNTCIICNRHSIDGLTHPSCTSRYSINGVFSSIAYKGVAKKLFYNFKYKPYLLDLKSFLSDIFFEGLIQKEEFNLALAENPIVVPIPLFHAKLKSRGYNQSEVLAKELAVRFNFKFFDILERVKNTKSQFKLKREERKENVKGAFALSKRFDLDQGRTLTGKSMFLIDDVLTTGSTLMEATNILKRAGAKKVWGITLAKD